MKIITKSDSLENIDFYIKEFRDGKIFIFPTDTIYGIGCIWKNKNSIDRIKKAKRRENKPFSIIVPNIDWIFKNTIVQNKDYENFILEKLPGKYTIILKLKNKEYEKINNIKTIGVRVLSNWFGDFIKKLNEPIIATSVNKSGNKNCISLDDLDKEIIPFVDYFIDVGKLDNNPSEIFDLTLEKIVKIR